MGTITVGRDAYEVELELDEPFTDLARWTARENHGRWRAGPDGLVGEWLSDSPSLFLNRPIAGDYLWQVRATRLPPSHDFNTRFQASKHSKGEDPALKYNFNFWLRAATPDGGDFLAAYPSKLGTGWNGMGDDYWRSYFTTVVRDPKDNWVRLRRSPGYECVEDIHDVLPHMPYGEPKLFTFVIRDGHIRFYADGVTLWDHQMADTHAYHEGYIGLCVWLCTVRFDRMKLYRFR
jgi:hypothetical protein